MARKAKVKTKPKPQTEPRPDPFEEFERRDAAAEEGGGPERIERQHKAGCQK